MCVREEGLGAWAGAGNNAQAQGVGAMIEMHRREEDIRGAGYEWCPVPTRVLHAEFRALV